MTRAELFNQIKKKKSYLCVGLDADLEKIPKHLLKTDDPVFEFNKQIIDATKDFCLAYKPNIAFYECLGVKGWQSLEKTLNYIPEDIFTIADAKRGDIGNTSKMYAKTFFEKYDFDAITVTPYMGSDSVKPFLEYKNKWAIVLALTSNEGAQDFQKSEVIPIVIGKEPEVRQLFEKVLHTSQNWGTNENMMYVIGATQSEMFKQVRKIVPDHFLLVPGVGAQGGDLKEVSKHGMNKECGLLVNVSRNIIYAGNGENFAEKAKEEAIKIQSEMNRL
ncbi:MAG TPA: orotidine-5'-phosphate decarboxylase, partial [Bacteroidia bacterium]|nr:orotidine-5'-phosphate decarboxylase [Bacteroidia bacterium]